MHQAFPPYTNCHILYQNIQSIRKYFSIVTQQPFFSQAYIVFFCESWLHEPNDDVDYIVNSHEMKRFDYPGAFSTRQHAGYVVYYKEPHVIANRLIAGAQFIICYVPALNV